MLVQMMHIRKMCMRVLDRIVFVDVGMGLLPTPVGVMLMLVMRIVDMRMFVFHGCMTVPMRVGFGEMQPHACPHEKSGDPQAAGQWRAERHGQGCADEG